MENQVNERAAIDDFQQAAVFRARSLSVAIQPFVALARTTGSTVVVGLTSRLDDEEHRDAPARARRVERPRHERPVAEPDPRLGELTPEPRPPPGREDDGRGGHERASGSCGFERPAHEDPREVLAVLDRAVEVGRRVGALGRELGRVVDRCAARERGLDR